MRVREKADARGTSSMEHSLSSSLLAQGTGRRYSREGRTKNRCLRSIGGRVPRPNLAKAASRGRWWGRPEDWRRQAWEREALLISLILSLLQRWLSSYLRRIKHGWRDWRRCRWCGLVTHAQFSGWHVTNKVF